MKMIAKLRRKSGFTMVELIVVIAIIGVLAAILVPTMLGYSTNSKVMSANSTAAQVQKSINLFLTEANAKQYGMYASLNYATEMTISITGGRWSLTNDDPNYFISSDEIRWTGSGSGFKNTPPPNGGNAEDVLASRLADLLPDLEKGYIKAYLEAGTCRALYFAPDTDQPVTMPAFVVGGWGTDVYRWNGHTAGINTDGDIVGTSPILALSLT